MLVEGAGILLLNQGSRIRVNRVVRNQFSHREFRTKDPPAKCYPLTPYGQVHKKMRPFNLRRHHLRSHCGHATNGPASAVGLPDGRARLQSAS
jgi:hypothetical protein